MRSTSRRDFLKHARSSALLVPILGLAPRLAESRGGRRASFSGATMGTTYRVTIADPDAHADLRGVKRDVARLLAGVDSRMSTFRETSELSRFNANRSTEWVELSADTVTVIGSALAASRLSRGAFDPTVGPVVNHWGFGPDGWRKRPPRARPDHGLSDRIGFRRVHVRSSPPAVRKERADISLDLSGIAKGFGLDQVAAHLEDSGIPRYLIDIGGEVRAGRSALRGPWKVGIEKPIPGRVAIHKVVRLENEALATSGDYRNFFYKNGVRYAHIIDPRTGEPVRHALAAVSVIRGSAMQADAVATALMVLGPEEGLALAEREKLAALFLVRDGHDFVERSTPAFDRHVVA